MLQGQSDVGKLPDGPEPAVPAEIIYTPSEELAACPVSEADTQVNPGVFYLGFDISKLSERQFPLLLCTWSAGTVSREQSAS
jgi:hypothetical protein